jgi:hypothetical protein
VLQQRKEERPRKVNSSVVYIRAHLQSSHKIFIINAELYKRFFATTKYVSALCYVSMCDELLMSFLEWNCERYGDGLLYPCMYMNKSKLYYSIILCKSQFLVFFNLFPLWGWAGAKAAWYFVL